MSWLVLTFSNILSQDWDWESSHHLHYFLKQRAFHPLAKAGVLPNFMATSNSKKVGK